MFSRRFWTESSQTLEKLIRILPILLMVLSQLAIQVKPAVAHRESSTILTMAVLPEGSGTTTPEIGEHPYDDVIVETIEAIANEGYVFSGWTGNVADPNSAITTVTTDETKTVTANFTPIEYTLTITGEHGMVTLDPPGGSYPSGTTVTLTANPDENFIFTGWSVNLIGTANPATITMDSDKTVNAGFAPGTCSSASLAASEDTYLNANEVTSNNGGNLFIHVNATIDTPRRGALLKWDLSSIPADAFVTSAGLSLNVTDESSLVFNLYNMRRSWVEGSDNSAPSNTSSNWNTYDGVISWDAGGAAGESLDRYSTNLWNADSTSFSATGKRTVAFNPEGVAVVSGWIDGSISNYGLTMQNYTGSTSDVLFFSSREAEEENRPKLNINYCIEGEPTIIITGTPLAPFATALGSPSATQTYTVTGTFLTDNITVTPPPGFEITTDDIIYYNHDSPLILDGSSSTVNQIISVRLIGNQEGTFEGSISHTSDGAAPQNVAVSGTTTVYFSLTTTVIGSGSVTFDPTGGSYVKGTTVTLTPVAGSSNIFVNWGGIDTGDIININGVYTIVMDADKSITANFATATCSTVDRQIDFDTYVSVADPDENYGGSTAIKVNGTTSTNRRGALLKWDLSDIPFTASEVVTSASISIFVTDPSSLLFNLYNMRQSWIEGTSDGVSSTNSANWQTYDGIHPWGTPGMVNTTSDRYETNLWTAQQNSFAADETTTTIELNQDGLAVIKRWLTHPASNHGFTIQNYTGARSTADALYFSSKNTSMVEKRPVLHLTYCSGPVVPAIEIVDSLSPFTSYKGVYSAPQIYTVSGTGLSGSITVAPPPNFEVSLDGTTWFGNPNTITVPTAASTNLLIRFMRLTPGFSSGNIIHTNPNSPQVYLRVSGTTVDGLPEITPVRPNNAATGVSTSPFLQLTVNDPDSDPSNVSIYGRSTEAVAGEDFMIVVLPDIQNESEKAPQMLFSQVNWIKDNQIANNIVFVTTVGDTGNNYSANRRQEYVNADAAFDILDAAGTPYTVAPGNHDTAMNTPEYNDEFFNISRYADHEINDPGGWFGGGYDDYNTFSLFRAGGIDFILINLDYRPDSDVINWADNLLTTYSNRQAIVEQHDILDVDDTFMNRSVYDGLRHHDNLFLMLCGHMHESNDGAAYFAGSGTGSAGQTIHIVLADYQDIENGNGYLRLLRFSPANNKIYMTTYSPLSGVTQITSSPDNMDLVYNMTPTAPFGLIGTIPDVLSGMNASTYWTGLALNTKYEWFASANGGAIVAPASSTSSFTTEIENLPPVLDPIGDKTIDELAELSFTAHATDSSTLTYAIIGAPPGAKIDSNSGLFTWIPTEEQGQGQYPFTVQVCEFPTPALCVSENITVTVNEVNLAPVLDHIDNKEVTELAPMAFTAHATDADLPANTLTYTLVGAPAGAAIDPSSGSFTWIPAEEQGPGEYTFAVKICDNAATPLCHEQSVTVAVAGICYTLNLTHTGQGSDPLATPPNSPKCASGKYITGELISLGNTIPGAAWRIDGWTGTNYDASKSSANTVSMPASDHTAGVIYIPLIPLSPSGNTAPANPAFMWKATNDPNLWFNLQVQSDNGNGRWQMALDAWYPARDICTSDTMTTSLCLIKPIKSIKSMIYRWNVRPYESMNSLGQESPFLEFSVGKIGISPIGAQAKPENQVTFRWYSQRDKTGYAATDYRITLLRGKTTIYNDPLIWFDSASVCNDSGICEKTLILNDLSDGMYSWNLQPRYGSRAVKAVSAGKFSYGPLAPTLIAPANNHALALPLSATLDFTWQQDPSAEFYLLMVEKQNPTSSLWIATRTLTISPSKTSPLFSCDGNRCIYHSGTKWAAGVYRWTLQAKANGGTGPGTQEVFSLGTALSTPLLISPLAFTVKPSDDSQKFAWEAVAGAESYILTIYSGKSKVYYNNSIDTTVAGCASGVCVFTLPTPLDYGAYSWTIQAKYLDGTKPKLSPISPKRVFNFGPPAPTNPAATVDSAKKPTLTWTCLNPDETDTYAISVDKLLKTGAWKIGALKLKSTSLNCQDTTCQYIAPKAWQTGTYRFTVQGGAYAAGSTKTMSLGPVSVFSESWTIP